MYYVPCIMYTLMGTYIINIVSVNKTKLITCIDATYHFRHVICILDTHIIDIHDH